MSEEFQIFGRSVQASDQTLVEQVYQILLDEIRSGRWKIGDRLPSISALAEESGISRSPIHRAYELLQDNGILRVEDRKGAFLLGNGQMELRAYGFVLLEAAIAQDPIHGSFVQQAVNETLRQAAARRAAIEVVTLRHEEDVRGIDLRGGGFFSSRIRGIISMHPFSHPYYDPLPPERIPLVFQGPYLPDSLPTVTGDTFYGMYNLTRRVIALGHREIALVSGRQPLTHPAFKERIRGFETAMLEATLPFNRRLFEKTQEMMFNSLEEPRKLIKAHPQITAWMFLMPFQAQQMALAAQSLNLKIPADLSIACFGQSPLSPGDPDRCLSCYAPDTEQIVRRCFDILEEQYNTRRCTQSLALVRPRLIEGHSLGIPRGAENIFKNELAAVD